MSKGKLKLLKVCTLSKVRVELLVKLFQSSFSKWIFFFVNFQKSFIYFWATTFEIYHITFIVFFYNRNSRLRYSQENTCHGVFFNKAFQWTLQKHSFWETSANGCFCIKVSYLCSTTVMSYVLLYWNTCTCNVIFSLIFIFCVNRNLLIMNKMH